MKKALIIAGALVVTLIALVLILPSLIDWNQYKGQITEQARLWTGRELVIAGDLDLTVFPSLALKADDIRFANVAGATSPDFLALKALRLRLAFLPLLSLEVAVQSVVLVEPTVEFEVLADGRTSLDFESPGNAPGATGGEPGGPSASDGGITIRLDRVLVEDGTLIYRDAQSGVVNKLERLNAEIQAETLQGPFRATGQATTSGVTIAFEASSGRLNSADRVPIGLSLGIDGVAAAAALTGALSSRGGAPELEGTLSLEAENLAQVMAALAPMLGPDAVMSPGPRHPFRLESSVTASAVGIDLDNIVASLGETRSTGALNVSLGAVPRADLALVVGPMDLDKWLAGAPRTSAGDQQTPARAEEGAGEAEAEAPAAAAFRLPEGVEGMVDVLIDAVAYKGGVIRKVRVSAALESGELTLNQVAAELPGGSEITLFGFLAPQDGAPRFEGHIELTSDNARGLLDWLQIDLAGVPADRLRKLEFKGMVVGTQEEVQISNAEIALDSSNMTGGVTVALRQRPAFGLSMSIDRINLDAYMPPPAAATEGSGDAGGDGATESGGAPKRSEGLGFAGLNEFDANLQANIGRLTYNDTQIQGISFDGTLYAGALTVRNLSVEDLAGAQAKLTATVGDFATQPTVKGALDFRAEDLGRLSRLAALTLPVPPELLGAVALTGTVDTDGDTMTVDVNLAALGGSADVAGTLSGLGHAPSYDFALTLEHPQPGHLLAIFAADGEASATDLEAMEVAAKVKGGPGGDGGQDIALDVDLKLAGGTFSGAGTIAGLGARAIYDLDLAADFPDLVRLVRTLSPDFKPAGQNLGGLKVLAAASGTDDDLKLSGLQGSIGPVNVKGNAAIGFGGPRPRVDLALSTSEVFVDLFTPASAPESESGGSAGTGQGGGTSAPTAGEAAQRWSSEPIDISFLRDFDGGLKVSMVALTFGKYRIVKPQAEIALADGVADVRQLTGEIFGGTIDAKGRIDGAGQTPGALIELEVSDIDVEAALAALADSDRATGRVSLETSLRATGRSESELVNGLSGQGRLDGTIRVETTGEETAGAILLGLLASEVRELQGVAGVAGAAMTAFGTGPAALSGTFTIERGIARTTDTKLEGERGIANVAGMIDLPPWVIDMEGTVVLRESPDDPFFTARVRGPMEAPDIKVGGRALSSATLTPVEGILDKLLPGLLGTQQPAPAAPATDPNAPPQPPQTEEENQSAPTTEQFIQNILKGLGN